MAGSPLAAHQATPGELRARIAAERRGLPFLVYRDDTGAQRIVELGDALRITLGRSAECDVRLESDLGRSRACTPRSERVGEQWVAVEDGLSSNGTFVGAKRISGRRRLADGDTLRVGGVVIAFRQPSADAVPSTRLSGDNQAAARVTPAQRRVLVALCRPFKGGAPDATPATNPQIAAELVLTVAAVKTHVRALCRAFGIDDLPQQEKRRRLVALAFASGLLSERDL